MAIHPLTRRSFLKTSAGLVGSSAFSSSLFARSGKTALDELVTWMEETPRDQILEQGINRIRQGLDYRTLLAAGSKAATRNVQPYPSVGYKYHNVMVLQSLHLLIESLPEKERVLPMLWQLDYFKRTQRDELRRSGWQMTELNINKVSARQARKNLEDALHNWDREGAEVAVVQLSRASSAGDVMQVLMPYSARDYRSLGHKPITAANALRMLKVNRGYGAESMLRSTVAAIINDEGDEKPHENDYFADRAWRLNRELLHTINLNAGNSKPDWSAGYELIQSLRSGNHREASLAVASMLNDAVMPPVLWEALLGGAGETMLNKSSFFALHANTMVNALYYMYLETTDAKARTLLLLQSAAMVALFRRDSGPSRRDLKLEDLEGLPCDSVEEAFTEMPNSRYQSIQKAFTVLNEGGEAARFIRLARQYTLDYAGNSHDFKYAEAVIENYQWMQSPWRRQYLSTSMFFLNGPHQEKDDIVSEAREIFT